MDEYTTSTKSWLDKRFMLTDDDGVYWAHQPIYGFRVGPTEPDMIGRYIITYQTMKALSDLKFKTFLDVGGAEGYKSALVRDLFDAKVRSCDLSQEACNRAREIFDVDGEAVDIHKLPYECEQFDVVLCSETLEHVPDIEGAVRELLRVCKKAVVITVPHESEAVINENVSKNIPHSHIHSLDLNSFDYLAPFCKNIISKRILSSLLRVPSALVDGVERNEAGGYPEFLIKLNNAFVPVFRKIFSAAAASFVIKLDETLSKHTPFYSGVLVVLIKDDSCYNPGVGRIITSRQIVDFKVPFYYLKSTK